GQGAGPGRARDIAVDADGGDEADTLLVTATDLGTEHAGGDHAHVAAGVEAAEGQRVAAGHHHQGGGPGRQGGGGDHVVGDEHADHVGLARGVEVVGHEPVGHGRVARGVGAHAD